jgi:hypothetical protein
MEATALSSPSGAQVRASRIGAIQQHVARTFSLRVEELSQRSRTRAVTLPRQMAMYLSKQFTDASLVEIGSHFGGKHHSTVMHSIAKIHQQRRTDPGKPRDQHAPKVFKSGFSTWQSVKMTAFVGRSPAINHGEQLSGIYAEFRAQFIDVGISFV